MEDRYLIGASGGTASSMAAYQKAFIEMLSPEEEAFLVPQMWRTMGGLVDQKLINAKTCKIKKWDKIGGSPISPSCKDTNLFKYKVDEGKYVDISEKARDFCEGYKGIIAIGGGGTTFQCMELNQAYGINSIVVLATMDNDVPGFDNTLGFPTAVQSAGESIIACVNDAMTMQRPMIIFILGYDCGRLAVNAVKYANEKLKSYGKVDLLQIPERKLSSKSYPKMLADKVRDSYNGGAFTIVVSEGCCEKKQKKEDKGIHKTYDTERFVRRVQKLTGIKFKTIKIDYRARSGCPVNMDRRLATQFAKKTFELIEEGKWNHVIGSMDGKIVAKPFEEVASDIRRDMKPMEWYNASYVSLDKVKDILV